MHERVGESAIRIHFVCLVYLVVYFLVLFNHGIHGIHGLVLAVEL